METIVLKKKKKIKIQVKVLIAVISALLLLSALVWLGINYEPIYEYYQIDNTGNYSTIGYATDKRLIEKAYILEIDKTYDNNMQVVNYELKTKISYKPTIVKRGSGNNDYVKAEIAKYVRITVYANILKYEDKTYYLQTAKGYKTLSVMRSINPKLKTYLLEGTYVDRDLLMTDEEIKNFLANYEKKFA